MIGISQINKTIIVIGHIIALAICICFLLFISDILYMEEPGLSCLAFIIASVLSICITDYNKLNKALVSSDVGSVKELVSGFLSGFMMLILLLVVMAPVVLLALLAALFIDFEYVLKIAIVMISGVAVYIGVLILYCLAIKAMSSASVMDDEVREARDYDRNTLRCVCPQCGSIFPRPVYECDCGQRFPDAGVGELRPSVNGTKRVVCFNCGKELPTTNRNGERALLKAYCPECDAPILTKEAHPYVITLAGPVGSGKTTLALSAISALERHAQATNPYAQQYSMTTPTAFSPPYIAGLPGCGRNGSYLAFFDISGRYFEGSQSVVGEQPQYGSEDVIVFVIDPTARDSVLTAETAVNDFWQTHHAVSQTSLSSIIRIPLHVVVTRRDVVGDQADVRGYLEKSGFAHVVSSLESSFKDVGYHICDARDEHEAAAVLEDFFRSVEPSVSSEFGKA